MFSARSADIDSGCNSATSLVVSPSDDITSTISLNSDLDTTHQERKSGLERLHSDLSQSAQHLQRYQQAEQHRSQPPKNETPLPSTPYVSRKCSVSSLIAAPMSNTSSMSSMMQVSAYNGGMGSDREDMSGNCGQQQNNIDISSTFSRDIPNISMTSITSTSAHPKMQNTKLPYLPTGPISIALAASTDGSNSPQVPLTPSITTPKLASSGFLTPARRNSICSTTSSTTTSMPVAPGPNAKHGRSFFDSPRNSFSKSYSASALRKSRTAATSSMLVALHSIDDPAVVSDSDTASSIVYTAPPLPSATVSSSSSSRRHNESNYHKHKSPANSAHSGSNSPQSLFPKLFHFTTSTSTSLPSPQKPAPPLSLEALTEHRNRKASSSTASKQIRTRKWITANSHVTGGPKPRSLSSSSSVPPKLVFKSTSSTMKPKMKAFNRVANDLRFEMFPLDQELEHESLVTSAMKSNRVGYFLHNKVLPLTSTKDASATRLHSTQDSSDSDTSISAEGPPPAQCDNLKRYDIISKANEAWNKHRAVSPSLSTSTVGGHISSMSIVGTRKRRNSVDDSDASTYGGSDDSEHRVNTKRRIVSTRSNAFLADAAEIGNSDSHSIRSKYESGFNDQSPDD
ncbi:DEBR0S3_05952g1_1 [Brettanomyces bruxellensis]|uniref:DEBR0S3_05952g1_1 n=1 Tax=Dekkera bruxellensis TaxID=5007 RepID=A0A7D9CXR4_DEKBR|nr:DEBR0S3_05952g1_1 [Brettanomyces bruxellensis]